MFNVSNRNTLDGEDIADYVYKMAERIDELERENEMLREIIRDYKFGVA